MGETKTAAFVKIASLSVWTAGVRNAIRAFFAARRSDCLKLLFCGKLDVMDILALCELYQMGLCQAPRYLPPWLSDPRYLQALLTYSTFMNKMSIEPLIAVANKLLESAPVVTIG